MVPVTGAPVSKKKGPWTSQEPFCFLWSQLCLMVRSQVLQAAYLCLHRVRRVQTQSQTGI